MGGIPQRGMLRERRVRMRGEVGLKLRMMGGRNCGLRTRRGARAQVFAAALFGKPALEAARADGEGGEHLLAWHAARNRCQHAFSEVERVTTHAPEYRPRS